MQTYIPCRPNIYTHMENIFILKIILYICLSFAEKWVCRSAVMKKANKINGLRAYLVMKKGMQRVCRRSAEGGKMVSNKKLGNDFEQEFCKILSRKGYWVHNFANRKNGQPADVIAVKNGTALLMDCKVCSNGIFDTSRIELNQHLAMRKWERCGNGTAWFALKLEDDIYVVHYNALDRQEKAISKRFIQMVGIKLEHFLEEQNEHSSK